MVKTILSVLAICGSAAFADWSGNPLETLSRLKTAEMRADVIMMQGDFRKESRPKQWPEPLCNPDNLPDCQYEES